MHFDITQIGILPRGRSWSSSPIECRGQVRSEKKCADLLTKWHLNFIGYAFDTHKSKGNHSDDDYYPNSQSMGRLLQTVHLLLDHPRSFTKVMGSAKRYNVTHCFK